MAIKIIKEGKKEFEYTCPYCGCVFTYELEDLALDDGINCPCCHKHLYINKANSITNYPYPNMIPCDRKVYDPMTVPDIVNPDKPNITWATQQSGKNCKDCHVYQKMMKGEYTVDDSCFWCPNNPYKVTCEAK